MSAMLQEQGKKISMAVAGKIFKLIVRKLYVTKHMCYKYDVFVCQGSEHENERLPAEVKNELSFTSIPPYFFRMWR